MADNRDNIIALESAEAIDEQAATWLTTLGRDDVSDDEREKFKNGSRKATVTAKRFTTCPLCGKTSPRSKTSKTSPKRRLQTMDGALN